MLTKVKIHPCGVHYILMPIDRFGWNKKSLIGLFWHQGLGLLSFIFDIAVIYLLIKLVHLDYPVAVMLGFIAATFANYFATRSTIYRNTLRPHKTAVTYFFIVAAVAMVVTVGGTVFLHEVVGVPVYVARVAIGIFFGLTGYLVDCLFVFKLR